MRVYFKGGNYQTITNRHYLASGGQAAIYAKNNKAFKIYHDTKGMISLGKIQELSELKDSCFIKPEEVLYDKKGTPVGYTMALVKGGITLCETFTQAYRKQHQLKHDQMFDLVEQLRDGMSFAHSKEILIVDANELNFLVSDCFDKLYFIDADSYQTKKYRATGLMESVKDWHTSSFCENSDWFSFGILSFQMFVGIHPYRGRYKGSLDKYKRKLPTDSLDDAFAVTRRRMQDGISVLHREVGVPRSVYSFDIIPDSLMDWYQAIFEKKKRLPPPGLIKGLKIIILPQAQKLLGTGNIEFNEVMRYRADIINAWMSEYGDVVLTAAGLFIGSASFSCDVPKIVVFSNQKKKPIFVSSDNIPRLHDIRGKKDIPFGMEALDVMAYDGRFYMRQEEQLYQVELSDMGDNIFPTTTPVCNILEHATRMHDGCVIQKLLGTTFVSIFPERDLHCQIKIVELDDYRIIQAKYDKNVFGVIAEKNGNYDRLIFRFSKDHKTYDCQVTSGVSNSVLNFVTLDTGVCILMNENEELELFSNRKGSQQKKIISDDALGHDIRLVKKSGTLMCYKDNILYSLKVNLKKT